MVIQVGSAQTIMSQNPLVFVQQLCSCSEFWEPQELLEVLLGFLDTKRDDEMLCIASVHLISRLVEHGHVGLSGSDARRLVNFLIDSRAA